MCNVEEFGQHNRKNTTGPAGWASRRHGDLSHSWLANDQILIFKEAFGQSQRHVEVKTYLKPWENVERDPDWVILAMLTVKLLVLSQRDKGLLATWAFLKIRKYWEWSVQKVSRVMAAREEVWTFFFFFFFLMRAQGLLPFRSTLEWKPSLGHI